MKKLLIQTLIILFLFTGCTIGKVDDTSINGIVETILYKNNNLQNTFFEGYKLYLPHGVNIIDKNEHNLKLKDNQTYYYLYVDTIAYHYNTVSTFSKNDEHFYSKMLDGADKKGFIDIVLNNDKYFIVLMYNYSKIEAYVSKEDLNSTFINMCYILSTVSYNDEIINSYVNDNNLTYQEENFDIFSSKKENDNFLTYEQQYDVYIKETPKKDDDILEIKENMEGD